MKKKLTTPGGNFPLLPYFQPLKMCLLRNGSPFFPGIHSLPSCHELQLAAFWKSLAAISYSLPCMSPEYTLMSLRPNKELKDVDHTIPITALQKQNKTKQEELNETDK